MLTEVALVASGRQRRPPFTLSSCLRAHSPGRKVGKTHTNCNPQSWLVSPGLSSFALSAHLSFFLPLMFLHLLVFRAAIHIMAL